MKILSTAALVTAITISLSTISLSAQGQGRARGRGGMQQSYNTLSGTYELDRTQGDNPERAAQAATRTMPAAQRDQAYRMLVARLQAPQTLSIERRGRTVTMGSTAGQQTTFEADGQTRTEPVVNNGNGGYNGGYRRAATTATRATFIGDRLSISSQGNRATDFVVTFEPLQAGTRMLVTRQIYNANYSTPVIARSYYTRVSTEPRWDLYTAGTPATTGTTYDPRGTRTAFLVPDNTRIFATLDSPIDTRTARAGDRFTMTVQGPNEYRDARIDGVIRSANVTTSDKPADLIVDFDTIRLRNGQTAPIDATLDTVRKPGGEVLRVDASGQTEKNNNTTRTVETGAIGAAIGGVIGVLTGGTKGAVIGAVIGGAAGAGGSILANSRDRYLDLPIGTEVTIVTTVPRGGTK